MCARHPYLCVPKHWNAFRSEFQGLFEFRVHHKALWLDPAVLSHTLCSHWPFIRTWCFSQPLHESSALTYTFCAGCVLLSAAGSGFILKRPAHFVCVVRRESARPFGKTIPFSFFSQFLFLIRHSRFLFSSPPSHFLSLWVSDPNSIQFQTCLDFGAAHRCISSPGTTVNVWLVVFLLWLIYHLVLQRSLFMLMHLSKSILVLSLTFVLQWILF